MADVQASGSDSSGKRSDSSTKTLLKPSAFATASASVSAAECVGIAGSFGNNPFASTRMPAQTNEGSVKQQQNSENPAVNKFVLRPSALDKHTSNLFKDSNFASPVKTNSFKLEPPKLFSPLSLNTTLSKSTNADDSEAQNTTTGAEDGKDEKKTQETIDSTKTTHSEDESTADGKQPATLEDANQNEQSGFIFGENLEARVTTVSAKSNNEAGVPAADAKSSFIFGSNIENRVVVSTREGLGEYQPEENSAKPDQAESPKDAESAIRPSSALSVDAAKHLAKSVENKVELKPVEVITGEENESNVFQFNAKLYIFNVTSQSWVERGRGLLRLNDRTEENSSRPFQSRLVMRTQGSLRVILNTMLWSGMVVERASAKSIQISAVDGDEGVKIFLLNANPNDAEQIFSAITSRVQQLKAVESSGKQTARDLATSAPTPKKRSLDPENSAENPKKLKQDQDPRREQTGEESNDSSALYPETEASNEGFASSPNIRSSSSSSDA